MDLDWISSRAMAAAIDLLHEILPHDLAMVTAGYLNDQRGIDAIQNATIYSYIRRIWIGPCTDHYEDGHDFAKEEYEATIFFTNSLRQQYQLCSHRIIWSNIAIWDFACGEDDPIITHVLSLHAKDAKQLAEWMFDARVELRGNIELGIMCM
jgi:hypothetical protein